MAAIAGENVALPEPVTREELFLKAILDAVQAGGDGSGGGGVLVVHEDENGVLDKTWKEIHDAGVCFIKSEEFDIETGSTATRYVQIVEVSTDGSSYVVIVSESQMYATDDENGYPAYVDQGDGGSGGGGQ